MQASEIPSSGRVKLGINGFGRIGEEFDCNRAGALFTHNYIVVSSSGRLVFRAAFRTRTARSSQ